MSSNPFFLTLLAASAMVQSAQNVDLVNWRWRCHGGNRPDAYCIRLKADMSGSDADALLGLDACKAVCGPSGSIWPRPESARISASVADISPPTEKSLVLRTPPDSPKLDSFVLEAFKVFLGDVLDANTDGQRADVKSSFGDRTLKVSVSIRSSDLTLDLNTDESYELFVSASSPSTAEANVTAPTYYGARHALETLSQLVTFDPSAFKIQIPTKVNVRDRPKFPYRGLLLDTGRNYYSVSSIKRIVEGLSRDKMNVLHWHMNEQHSFPFVSESEPEMSRWGAASAREVYTRADVEEVVRLGLLRGVAVVPEFDAPAHASRGWEWGPEKGKGDLVVCNGKRWADGNVVLANEPNAGQLNPVNKNVYAVLENIYKDMIAAFTVEENPVSMFHMGGDEVNFNCWHQSEQIVAWMRQNGFAEDPSIDPSGYLELWGQFQDKAFKRLLAAKGDRRPFKHGAVMWTSDLAKVEHVERYLPKEKYTIQLWCKGDDPWVGQLLDKGYRLIFSNSDAWYLDCGFGQWTWDGMSVDNNWCSPFKSWKKMYENSPRGLISDVGLDWDGKAKKLVLGGEAALWSEQADENNAESRVWPRLSAVAERLWSDPTTSWRDAEARILQQRHRMVQRGVRADAIQPSFCRRNEGWCYAPGSRPAVGDQGPRLQDFMDASDRELLEQARQQQEQPHPPARGDLPRQRDKGDDDGSTGLSMRREPLAPTEDGGGAPDVRAVPVPPPSPRSATNHTLLTLATVAFMLYMLWLARRSLMGFLVSRAQRVKDNSQMA